MGSIHSYKTGEGKRYMVKYRKPDNSQTSKRGFKTKRDAERFLSSTSVSIAEKRYIDPTDARITVGELGAIWMTDQSAVLKPSSVHPLESAWRIHVEPAWGNRQVGDIRHSDVRAWVSQLSNTRGPTTVIRSFGILSAILDIAVRDRRLADNPARGVKLPKKRPKPRVYLTHRQVAELAQRAAYPHVVYFLSYTGLRWGEATGLRLRDVDLTRRRVTVYENAVLVNGHIHVGSPKSHRTRSVRYPDFLDPMIRSLFVGKDATQLLFGDGTDHLRLPNSKDGWFARAVRRAQKEDPTFPRVTPHDLRHTAASLAISAGANVKAVQRMLGHASAAMTLGTYADLFDDDLDAVATALAHARNRSIYPPSDTPVVLPPEVPGIGI
ncbi:MULTISPECIES: tyrosine-type recombinase/integrase [Microbacterium]|uniref:tyrosine-type recombinase/integrase n=1 Tax=Microbacterium TaxID=33882 RepID=UPI00146F5E77|nr:MULTISPECIES: tyrosine-type recombinase/integrase [Microbacterium]